MLYYRVYRNSPNHHEYGYDASNGARWNSSGTAMIYVSSSAALAMLENVTNKGNELRAVEFIMATYKVKMELESLNPDVLPGNWNLYPHPASTKNFGDRWVNGGGNFLKVPSSRMPLAAYPEEHNLLVNPKNIHLKEELIVLEKIPVSFLLSF